MQHIRGSVVQLVRMPPCHGGGRGFESRPVRKKPLYQVDIQGFLFLRVAKLVAIEDFQTEEPEQH